jgi:hypothetical protein
VVDIEGVHSDVFMQEVDTWPKTRVNVLDKTRKLLKKRFKALHTRNIDIRQWFTNLSVVGMGGFGVVYKGCIREWDAALTAVLPEHCVQYRLPDAEDPTAKHSISLIIKTMKDLQGYELLDDSPIAAHTKDFSTYLGDVNAAREIAIGQLLNALVVHGVTPHMPLIYEPFYIKGDREDGMQDEGEGEGAGAGAGAEPEAMSAFAMELAHMSLSNFLTSNAMSTSSSEEIVELLDVTLLQLANGLLCAHKHYDFRHNDFHTDNAMMTFITDTTYTYKVNGSFYRIPNYGMCWKLIDFGFSSARVLHEHDVAHAAMHSASLSVLNAVTFDFTDFAAELYDLVRLVTYGKENTMMLRADKRRVVERRFKEYEDMLRDISVSSPKRGSLQLAHEAFIRNATRRDKSKLLRTTAEFSARMQSSGLVEVFFERLASRFKVPAPLAPPAGTVFDAEKSPFGEGGGIVLDL